MESLSQFQVFTVSLIFIWSGFVRGGLGFGGAALAMPLMLLVINDPLIWLPMVANHLLIFSTLTIYNRLANIDWVYLKKALLVMLIPKIAGVFGLISLPTVLLVNLIYGVTFIYALTYIMDYKFSSKNRLVDNILLFFGGYASGTSLIGAPLISAVFSRHVEISRLRDTLFGLWIILVIIKMSTFIVFEVNLQFKYTLYMLPAAAIGHWLGLKLHREVDSRR